MSFSRLLAARMTFGRRRAVTKLSVLLALISIMLGVTVMDVAVSIVDGFETALTDKVTGFVSDMRIMRQNPAANQQKRPLERQPKVEQRLRQALPGLEHMDVFVLYEGLLKGNKGHQGIRLKGLARGWDSTFFQQSLVAGHLPTLPDSGFGRQVLISRQMAQLLELEVGDESVLVFYQSGAGRYRKVQIAGLYETGLMELDRSIVLCDIRLLQQLLDWQPNQVDGYELQLATRDTARLRKLQARINRLIPYDWQAYSARELHSQIFDWIGLQHQNVWFILALLLIVAIVNMATALLILITERTRMIGLLKALGATDTQVRNSFLWQALFLIGVGVAAGNVLAFGLLGLQDGLALIQLDPTSYFVSTVPVGWPWLRFLGVNALIIALSTLAMLLPTGLVLRISPVRALRF